MTSPTVVRALRQDRVFELQWPNEPVHRVPFFRARCLCPCAECVNEITGERMLDPQHIAADIAPTALAAVGNYAVKITWSDGHASGLFTWEHLHDIATSSPPPE